MAALCGAIVAVVVVIRYLASAETRVVLRLQECCSERDLEAFLSRVIGRHDFFSLLVVSLSV